jgi:hypothetical protein
MAKSDTCSYTTFSGEETLDRAADVFSELTTSMRNFVENSFANGFLHFDNFLVARSVRASRGFQAPVLAREYDFPIAEDWALKDVARKLESDNTSGESGGIARKNVELLYYQQNLPDFTYWRAAEPRRFDLFDFEVKSINAPALSVTLTDPSGANAGGL